MDLNERIRDAMHRIEEMYYETEGKCYLSFSGGKDSTVILAIIKMCEEIYTIPKNSIPAVFCDTGIELGATRDFVRWCRDNWYSNIVIIRPEKSFSWILENKGKPIKSKMKSEMLSRYKRKKETNENAFKYLMEINNEGKKYAKTKIADKDLHLMHDDFDIKVSNKCCEFLKKKPFEVYQKEKGMKGYITGMRISEGGSRELNTIKRVQNGGKLCTATKGEYISKMPIIDWKEEDIEAFIKEYNVPLSKAYTEYGQTRTGCMGCPFALEITQNLEMLWKHEPNRYKASMHWLKDVYIAQNVALPFDEEYEKEREHKWKTMYAPMREEMLLKYRPNSRLCKGFIQLELDMEGEKIG